HLVGVRMDPGTGSLAEAGGHTRGVPGLQIQQVNLIKGIIRLAFTLKNHALAVGAKIALASAPSGKGDLVCLGQQACFIIWLGWGHTRVCQPDGSTDKHDEQDSPKMRHHDNSPVGMVLPRAVGSVINFGNVLATTLHLTTSAHCFIYSTKVSTWTPLATRARRRHAQEAGIPQAEWSYIGATGVAAGAAAGWRRHRWGLAISRDRDGGSAAEGRPGHRRHPSGPVCPAGYYCSRRHTRRLGQRWRPASDRRRRWRV